MTVQEAISCLKADKKYLKDHNICDGKEIDAAIEALEKQIPKKPVDNPEEGWFECPNCGSIVWVYYGTGEKHHCECGQALDLDWEEIE